MSKGKFEAPNRNSKFNIQGCQVGLQSSGPQDLIQALDISPGVGIVAIKKDYYYD